MGLPEIDIKFRSLAVSAVQRSQRGIVALILKNTGTFTSKEYKTVTDIVSTEWSVENVGYIKQAFLGSPNKVIVERLDTTATDYSAALTSLASKKFDYLAVPGIAAEDVADISTWIKTERDVNKKTYKAVLPNSASDHEGIINFTTEGIKVGTSTFSASQFTARIAGILAGLPLTRSATYYVLPEVESITEHADPDGDIDAGELILINDGAKIKIARGVNSLTTTTTDKSADFKKIKIVEGMDIIRTDIKQTFEDEYVGKVNNSYDNQVLFLSAATSYIQTLRGDVLDPVHNNRVDVDVEAQRLAWQGVGTDVSDLTDEQVKEMSFGSKVFVAGSLKFLDAMEDLSFSISV